MTTLPGRLVLIGHPVVHSLSPTFQNAALRRARLPIEYEVRDVPPAQLNAVVVTLRAERAAGNVTVPHKESFAALCDRLTPIADRVGAVNTFWMEDGALVGDNTDVGGFEEAVARAFGAQRTWSRVALMGAGGSAAAVIAAVERWPGARVAIWTRTTERAVRLAQRFRHVEVARTRASALMDAELVVNATPLGRTADDPLPVPIQELPRHAACFDLVYQRNETAWVRAARGAGHPAADGLGMLVAQGALAFERWFGMVPDRDAMWTSLES